MIDPELAALVDVLPVIDLSDPVAAREAFEEILVAHQDRHPRHRDPRDRGPAWCPDGRATPTWRCASTGPARRRAGAGAPGIVMIHGGGFMIGSVEAEHAGAALTAIDTGAVVVSVEYRLAPEHPYPAGLHDCYAALSLPARRGRRAGRRPGAGGPARGERRGRAGGGDRAAGPRPRRAAGLLPDAAHPRARRPARDAVHADLRRLAAVEPPARRAELAGVPRASCRERPTCRPTRHRPGRPISRACRRPTSRRPRTTRCATRGSSTPSACCRPGVSVELHQFPGTFHGSALVTTAAVSKRAQREAALVLRRALGVDTGAAPGG